MLDDPAETGSYRVQVATEKEFAHVLFEKIYLFEEGGTLKEDLTKGGLRGGRYWIRLAFIDLLDFQHPYSAPRRFRLAPSADLAVPNAGRRQRP
jgi:hypothetical protein